MDRTGNIRQAGWLIVLAVGFASGCQTVKTPEEKIANSNIPSEFKKVTMPDYVIEAPDMVLVEVLDALPGRPISGERLVRPDGKISLGFYGEVFVAGLTISEAKEKVIYHLRKYLSDEGLGLLQMQDSADGFSEPKLDKDGKPMLIEDFKDCDRVFLDVTAYNSKNYYVLGDVAAPGRLPVTGNETVLDAIEFSGGLLPTAASQNVRLVRPAPPGACCEQVLPVNLAAIMSGGDSTTNYQLMPGDRVVVYRDPIVRATIFIDRIAAPFQTVLNSMLQYSFTARSIQYLGLGAGATGLGGTGGTSTTRTTPTLPNQPGAR